MTDGPTQDFDVVTLGEAMVLFAAQEPGALDSVARFQRFSAGAELNVAIGLARLGLRVAYLSRLGDDSFGRSLLGVMQQEGVSTALVETTPARPTGFMLKSLSTDGSDPQVEYFRRGSAASAMGPHDLQRLTAVSARHLHLTGISPALSPGCRALVLETLGWARARGMRISFDPNLRPRLWPSTQEMVHTVNLMASQSDIVLPGIAEGRMLTGTDAPAEIARFYLDAGARQVVVKLGAEGAWCADQSGAAFMVPGFAVDRVVDTVGAGDGFAVGVISALLEGLDLHAAARRGNAVGARVVQFPGDSDGLPTQGQLDAVMNVHRVVDGPTRAQG